MKIHGLQKMTLLDFPGRVACTVFTGGCDLRCPFCHNSELLDGTAPPIMTDEELFAFLEKRKGLLDGVAVTGGEPLLSDSVIPMLERIKEMGFALKLDSNGTHPERLKRIIGMGLADYVAMDIKNDKERYALTAGVEKLDIEAISESVDFLISGYVDYEFRTTTIDELHDEDSFRHIAEWIRGAKNYYLQSFVDRDTVVFEGFHAPSDEKMARYAEIMRPYVSNVAIRGR